MHMITNPGTRQKCRTVLRTAAWYLFWLTVMLLLYKPALLMFPKKDHFFFMLGHQLFDSDLVWFFKTLSYNRTRVLAPGDYFAFRPLFMAVLGLEDIFFRHNLLALGVIGCSLASFTATAFFMVTRRITGNLTAILLTLTWGASLAGSEMILWQHITAYILAPGFLCLGLAQLAPAPESSKKQWLAGLWILAACLTHEICVIVSAAFALLVFLALYKEPSKRGRMALCFLVPAVFALTLNAVDYFLLNPPPSLRRQADNVNPENMGVVLDSLGSFFGAIGVAVFSPFSVKMIALDDWSHLWMFTNLPPGLLITCGTGIFALQTAGIVQVLRHFKNGTASSPAPLATTLFLLFFWVTFAVCGVRFATRGVKYLYEATYYFSFFTFSLCGLLSSLVAMLAKPRLRQGAIVLMALGAGFHVVVLQSFLRSTSPDKIAIENTFHSMRALLGNNPQACFDGMDVTSIPPIYNLWTPLFNDLSCNARPDAVPLYLTLREGMLLLARLDITEPPAQLQDRWALNKESRAAIQQFKYELTYGTPFEFTLTDTPSFALILFDPTGGFRGFKVDHNFVTQLRKVQFVPTPWRPRQRDVIYRVVFTPDEMLLLENNTLIYSLPVEQELQGSTSRILLTTIQKTAVLGLKGFRVAPQPVVAELRFPLYIIDWQP